MTIFPDEADYHPPDRRFSIMVLAGEASGDVHGADLIRELRMLDPCVGIMAMGGLCMASAGADIFFPIEKLSVMGLTEVLFQIKNIREAFLSFKRNLAKYRPNIIVLIDHPGFNLRAAAYAKKNFDVKIVYYITPKVWAWHIGRLKTIRTYIDHAALIFPFEIKLYKKACIPSTYVGNPLLDHIDRWILPDIKKRRICSTDDTLTIGLLPGSRKPEIDNLLEIMLEAAKLIAGRRKNCKFLVSCADSISLESITAVTDRFNGLFDVIYGHPGSIFRRADLLIAASGTVTLEAALFCLPTIIVYRMSSLSFLIAKFLVRIKYVGLANIITGSEVMPELIQEDMTPFNIMNKAFEMLNDLSVYADKLAVVRKLIGPPGAAGRTAQIVMDLMPIGE